MCLHDPGFDVDLLVSADTVTLHQVWMGRMSFVGAMRQGLIELHGPAELACAFPNWLALNVFAHVPPAANPSQ